MEKDFSCPPNHIGFSAKKLFGEMGEIADGAIAYIEKDGGGPIEPHTHEHSHLFIVVKGRARIDMDGKQTVINENGSFLVDGSVPHSVWNDCDEQTVMIGISVK